MKTYYYVHTGHRIGLDRFRRATTILRLLKDEDITLLCSDFRIANEARDFGVDKAVGIDVVRNIPQITHFRDRLIFDSDEANPIMLEDMKNYFSSFLHIPEEMVVVDDKYFKEYEKTIPLSFFFGDDDYEKDLEKNLSFLDGLDVDLQLGYYYFFDYEDMLKEKFPRHYEFEDYDDVITKSQVLITASPQAVLENLAAGGKPIYIQRDDYTEKFQDNFKKLNIPIIKSYDNRQLLTILDGISEHQYYELEHDNKELSKFIRESLNL